MSTEGEKIMYRAHISEGVVVAVRIVRETTRTYCVVPSSATGYYSRLGKENGIGRLLRETWAEAHQDLVQGLINRLVRLKQEVLQTEGRLNAAKAMKDPTA